jgi:hypothetical protein
VFAVPEDVESLACADDPARTGAGDTAGPIRSRRRRGYGSAPIRHRYAMRTNGQFVHQIAVFSSVAKVTHAQ